MTYLRQCPDCKTIVAYDGKNRAKMLPSIVTLKNVEQVRCHKCKHGEVDRSLPRLHNGNSKIK